MPGDQYEPNRVLGFPVRRPDPRPGHDRAVRGRAAPDEEPQRVAGFPVDWFSGSGPRPGPGRLGSLLREFRRRLRRRPPY